MRSTIRQASFLGLTSRKAVLALALASPLSGLAISPAFADRDHDNGRGRGHRHGDHQRDWQRDWRGDRDGYYGYQPEYRRPYYYAQPVYVPPPVYYAPRQSPGVSLFFPLDLRR